MVREVKTNDALHNAGVSSSSPRVAYSMTSPMHMLSRGRVFRTTSSSVYSKKQCIFQNQGFSEVDIPIEEHAEESVASVQDLARQGRRVLGG